MRGRVWAACITLTIALSGATPGLGQEAVPTSVRGLIARADIVVRGRVAAVLYGREPGSRLIYTYTRVKVSEWLGAGEPVPELVMKQLGGRLGDTLMVFTTQTDHAVGDDVLLLLGARELDGAVYPIGQHGLGYVRGRPGVEIVEFGVRQDQQAGPRASYRAVRRAAVRGARVPDASRRVVVLPPDTPPELFRDQPASPPITAQLAARGHRWKAREAFSFLKHQPSPFKDQRTFGRWWPIVESGLGVSVVVDSTSEQYGFAPGGSVDRDELAASSAARHWGDVELARLPRRRLRLRGGVSRRVDCKGPPFAPVQFAESDYPRHVGVTFKNSCGFLMDGDPSFALAGFVATVGRADVVATGSKVHGDRQTVARITSAIVQMNRGTDEFPVGDESYSINDIWKGGDRGAFGLRCFTVALTHMLGHTFGIGHTVLRGEHPRSRTRPGRNIMDASFHGLDSDPPFDTACLGDQGRLGLGSADRLGLDRLLRDPVPAR